MAEENSSGVFRWRVLSDQAIGRSEDDSFGVHAAFARLLYDLAQSCTTPFAVGLYSGWGTGKTSVSRMLEERIGADQPRSLGYVYLDVWKYVSDPLKRWILLETERQLQGQHLLPENYTFEGRTLESHLEFEEEWVEKSEATLDPVLSSKFVFWFWVAALGGGSTSALLLVLANQIPRVLALLIPLASLIASAGLLGLILRPMLELLLDYLRKIGFRRITWNVRAKPAFSSEKFGAIFRDMVRTAAQNPTAHKIVFVFDNLDRCPEAVAIETIAVVKTYLDETGCVYVIPCDQDAIVTHVAHSYTGSGDPTAARQYAREFLNKFFQMTIRLPAPADYDLEAFIDKQLRDAGMENLSPAARDVLVLGYRGETPRQVKRILNDLVGYSALALAAEGAKLLDEGDLTADLAFLTKMSVISANWPEFLERMANDPEIWASIGGALQDGREISSIVREPALEEFLRRTRWLSPDADIRPYLFLKRVSFERNASLRTQVERPLRNGELEPFQKLFVNPDYSDKVQNILDMTTNSIRKWRTTARDALVKNAAPLVVWAAARHIEDRDLVQETLAVLEEVGSVVPPLQLESLFDPEDIFAVVASATGLQRRNILAAYAKPFGVEAEGTERRKQIFSAFLKHRELVDEQVKASLHEALLFAERFPVYESHHLDILALAGKNPIDDSWAVPPDLLTQVAEKTRFLSDLLDRKRLSVLASLQDCLPPKARAVLVANMAARIPPPARTIPATDIVTVNEALRQFKPTALGDTSPLASVLLGQVEAHAVQERAPWTSSLLFLLPTLSDALRDRFAEAIRASYLEIANPAGVTTFLEQIGEAGIERALALAGMVDAVRSEAQLLEGKIGFPTASTYRQQHLQRFPVAQRVTNLALYDTSRVWDLVIYINNVKQALDAGFTDKGTISAQLAKLAAAFPSSDAKVNRPVYDALCSLTDSHPDVMNSDVAKALADSAISYLAVNLDDDYRVFRKCLARLSPPDRIASIKRLENRCLRDSAGDRTRLLANVTEDVCSEADVQTREALVGEVFDFAYSAASTYPAAATESLLRLSDYLEADTRAVYLDRSLDRLNYLEAGDKNLEQMEPFLRLVPKFKQEIVGESEEKFGRFLKRMLSPASEKQRKLRIIDLLVNLGVPALVDAVGAELQDVTQSSDPDLASKAAQLVKPS